MDIYHKLGEVLKKARQRFSRAFIKLVETVPFRRRPLTLAEQILRNLDQLKASHFAAVYSSNMSIYTVDPLYDGIEEYIHKLELATNILETSQDAPVTLFNSVPKRTLVAQFFMNDKRQYLDSVDVGMQFVSAARNFARWYSEREVSIDNITHVRNIRVFYYVAANLLTLTEQLRHLRS